MKTIEREEKTRMRKGIEKEKARIRHQKQKERVRKKVKEAA